METTSNLGLKKPEGTDVVDITVLNDNADILDTEVTKLASTTVAGRMSAADKAKLNGIAAGATAVANSGTNGVITINGTNQTVYAHPTGAGNNHIPAGGASGNFLKYSAAGTAAWATPAKGDIGLGSVENYGIASQSEAETGTATNKYMTPLRTAQAIAVNLEREDITGQTLDVNTINLSGGSPTARYFIEKSTGGAANITNVPVKEPFLLDVELIRYASASDYITRQTFISATTKITYIRWCTNGTWASWYQNYDAVSLTGATTSAAGLMSAADKTKLNGVAAGAQVNTVTSVAGKTGAVTVTKSDAGLGSVENYAVASQAEAQAGTATNRYMTPQRTAQAIASLAPAAPVQSVAGKTGAVTLTGTDVPAATTSARGTVQLSTATNSTSTTLAATASAVKAAYDQGSAGVTAAAAAQAKADAALPRDGSQGMTGPLYLQGSGTNGLINGNGDAASFDTQNFRIRGHWGMGMETYNGSVNGYYDFRSGKWDVKDGYYINGSKLAQTRVNNGQLEFFDGGAWKTVGGIKSVQRGLTNFYGGLSIDVTISQVNMDKSFILVNQSPGAIGSLARAELTSSTNIKLSIISFYSPNADLYPVSWQVVEFY